MRNYGLVSRLALGTFISVVVSSALLTFAAAHEAHQATCSETAMNAVEADIQSMPDGDAKATAMQELEMAEEMMGKEDMKGCEDHMHAAMEALEE
ncbi:MAG: hypothetical protein ACRECX_11415 [Methyloceanibacter sp.]|uniref:hypothetical protein n=1 Tax=Methyloceanibacter sp. TaxID=1965321 RepID=UPI003D6D097E